MPLLKTKEETNFARIAQVVLTLFPQVIRNHLASIVDPSTLTRPVTLKKNAKVKLSKDQSSIVNNIPTAGDYQECDTTLLYLLFRNLPGVNISPISGWGNKVNVNHLSPADDLERMRILRNEMLGHVNKASISDQDYNTFLQTAELILNRFDNCHGNIYAPYAGTGTYVKELKNIEGKVIDETFNTYKQDLLVLKANDLAIENKVKANEIAVEKRITDVEECVGELKGNEAMISTRITDVEESVKATDDATRLQIRSIEGEIQTLKTICNQQKDLEELRQDGNSDDRADNGVPISHCYKIQHRSWFTWCHHSTSYNPSMLLSSFKSDLYLPETVSYELYENGNTQYYTLNELNTKFLHKFYEIFGEEMYHQPWLFTNINEDCVSDKKFYILCKKLELCAKFKNYSFLFVDYDYEENLRQLNYDIRGLSTDLSLELQGESRHRIILYLAEYRTIFNIRYIEIGKQEGPENIELSIMREVRNCEEDLMLFSTLHMDSLRNSGICIIALLVVGDISKASLWELSLCDMCISNLILTSDDIDINIDEKGICVDNRIKVDKSTIDDIHSLNQKLSNILKQRQERFLSVESLQENVKETFEKLASRVWASMSVKDVHLPNLSNEDQNTLVRIYLNRYQRNFLYSTFNHVILRGGYGSGKSILAQVKFKELVNKADVDDVLYFLCFSNDTLYIDMIKAHIKEMIPSGLRHDQITIMNVDEYLMRNNLQNSIPISQILKHLIGKYKEKRLSLVVDEMDGSALSMKEAANIKLFLSYFSYILFVMQSLEVSRKLVRIKSVLKKTEIMHEGHHLKNTDMQVVTLNLIMRNTTKINALSLVATNIFERHTNIFFERTPVENRTEVKKEVDNEDDHLPKSVQFSQSKSDVDGVDQCVSTEDCISQNAHELQTPYSNLERSDYHYHRSKDYQVDHEMKIVSSHKYSTRKRHESNFHFPGEWKNGHAIKGCPPKVIYPFGNTAVCYENVNSHGIRSKIYLTLKDILNIGNQIEELCILSFDSIDAQLLYETIQIMGYPVVLYAPALQLVSCDSFEDLSKILKTHILITDHLGARGMEFKRLIVTFNPHEQYVSQYFIEAFTRAIFELTFIVIYKDCDDVTENKHVCKSIMAAWIKQKLVKETTVKDCKSHLIDIWQSPPYCKDDKKSKIVYRIHASHESFNICERVREIKEPVVDVEKAVVQLRTWAKTKESLSVETKHRQDLRRKLRNATKVPLAGSQVKCVIIGDNNASTHWLKKTCTELNKGLVDFDGEFVGITFMDTSQYREFYDRINGLYRNADVFLLCFSIADRSSFKSIYHIWIPETGVRPGIPRLLIGIDESLEEEYAQTRNVDSDEGWELAKDIEAVTYFEYSINRPSDLLKTINEITALSALADKKEMRKISLKNADS